MTLRKLITLTLIIALTSCVDSISDDEKIALAEKECGQKTSIDGLYLMFYGYFPNDADSLFIKIKRGDSICDSYVDKIPAEVHDSIRHLREYQIKKTILLTDTLILKIKSEPEKKIYGFKYIVNPHFTMGNSGWGCDFYECTIDGKVCEGDVARITKNGWNLIDRKNFRNYYYNK